jgi:methylated-DNA-[protein]-cysteine S-methyltransferase
MEVTGGSCRLGLWFVHVWWSGSTVHRVRFSTTGIAGDVPEPFRKFCAGHPVDLTQFATVAIVMDTPYSRIYRAVKNVPYGSTSTYGEIARLVGTSPRVVGQAMANNPTPLVIPCHRIVAASGIGGFSPDVGIKELLLAMEKKTLQKLLVAKKSSSYPVSGIPPEYHKSRER